MTSKELTISGKIIFTNGEPESPLPNPSILNVKLEDCSLADACAIGVAEVTINAHETYVKGQPLTYSIHIQNVDHCPHFGVEVSAVLNIGWKPEKIGDDYEWIRKGDYLSDTHHPVDIMRLKHNNNQVNVNVVHYT